MSKFRQLIEQELGYINEVVTSLPSGATSKGNPTKVTTTGEVSPDTAQGTTQPFDAKKAAADFINSLGVNLEMFDAAYQVDPKILAIRKKQQQTTVNPAVQQSTQQSNPNISSTQKI